MLPIMIHSTRKLLRLVYVSLVVLALVPVLIASSNSAASLQFSQSPQSPQSPDATCPAGGQCFADVPSTSPFYEFANRIYQQNLVTGYPCGGFGEPCDPENRPYYRPGLEVTRQQMSKFVDQARQQPGIYIDTATDDSPLYSRTTAANGEGVMGVADSGSNSTGVYGSSASGFGVRGFSTAIDRFGVVGVAENGSNSNGVRGISTAGIGVYGTGGAWAGYFQGNIYVSGACTGCLGSSKIDHPLDPQNKYLVHSAVESPDMMNVYNGNITTDGIGEATIQLPDWFSALNRDFRYQLTTIGQHADAWIASEVKDNQFSIKTDKPNVKVSWQITGIRQDPYANAHRIPVEEDKPADEQGKYLHPTEWGQPASSGIDYEEQQRIQELLQDKGER
jgi:hypothetical protein